MAASVRLYGLPAGTLSVGRDGSLSFRYDDGWLSRTDVDEYLHHPISLAMPFTDETYGNDRAGPFFDGLLPDNKATREALGRHFQIDASDDYQLLYNLGRECPGAISILPPEESVIPEPAVRPEYDLLDDERLAEHIADLPRRPLFVDADGEMRLSLAGVHHKSAVVLTRGKVGLPRGRTPTSHILKVDIDGLHDSIRVENYCLKLAGRLGMTIPQSTVRLAGETPYMLIARYDRAAVAGEGFTYIRRLHQEDFCQALGRFPREKYEKDGGPGWRECFDLMERTSDPAASRLELLARAIFQFLVYNPDAHAKNYSIVYRNGTINLSPLYDVNNAAAFRKHYKEQRARVAMFVGGERDPNAITAEHWTAFAHEAGLRPELVHRTISGMASAMPTAARDLREELKGTPEDTDLLDLVIGDVDQRCARVLGWNAR